MWKQKMIVLVTIVLHNYICENTSGNIDFERVEHDEDYEHMKLERYNKYVGPPSNKSTSLPNAPTMDNFHDELPMTISLGWN
jgi:hypothetical protein